MESLTEYFIDYILNKKTLKTYGLKFLNIKLYSFSYSRVPIVWLQLEIDILKNLSRN